MISGHLTRKVRADQRGRTVYRRCLPCPRRTPPPPRPAATRGLPTDALLVGRLSIARGLGGRPHLTVAVWCPACRATHRHGWELEGEGRSHRQAHCGGGPLREGGYYVGLDPAARAENEAVLARFRAALAAREKKAEGRQ